MRDGAVDKETKQSYIEDVLILRRRRMTTKEIAAALGLHARTVERWAAQLKSDHMWPRFVWEFKPNRRHTHPEEFVDAEGRYSAK